MKHLDIIERASKIFEKVIVLVVKNNNEKATLSANKRVELVKLATENFDNVEVDYWEKFLIDYVELSGACVIIKELFYNNENFYCELKNSFLNRSLEKSVETVFLPADCRFVHMESKIVKQLFFSGMEREIEKMVPKNVLSNVIKFLSEVKHECKQHIR